MGRKFSSARFRRRLLWAVSLLVAGGLIAALVVEFPSPKPSPNSRVSTEKAKLVQPAKPAAFAPKKQEILHTAMQFVAFAVTRHDVARSWDLVTPTMREGHTRADWVSGRDLPVIKYPAIYATWHLAYSLKDEVDIQVALFSKPHQIRPQVFDITLHPVHRGKQTKWLVDSFLPTPAEGGGIGNGNPNRTNLFGPQGPRTQQIGKVWLIVPLAIFALLPALLIALGVRRWRAARIYRAYARGN